MGTNAEHCTKQLKKHLDALDGHDSETRRMLDTKAYYPAKTWDARSDKREDLVANVIVAARTLVSLPPERPIVTRVDVHEVAP